MSTATDDGGRVEEAGTDEVAALAAMIAAPTRPHLEDVEDEAETLSLAPDDGDETVPVLPRQRDEFTCPRCYLVMHLSRRVGDVCRDCS